MKLACPACSTEFEVEPMAAVPEQQRFTVTCGNDTGSPLGAKTVGRLLDKAAAVLIAVARDVDVRVEVFVESVRLEAGRFTADLSVVRLADKKEAPR